MPKRVSVGVVTSDKMAKTRVVDIPRLEKHPKYGKYIRKRTKCYVHDEGEQSSVGDMVEIVESRPRSRLKRWELVRVLGKSQGVEQVLEQAGGELQQAGGESEAGSALSEV